ncbi:protein kinase [Cryptosporidium canis]|uniref:Protein kinase n=1 Tax=Cryptosporidium canis TaxID=195482 RepID=A0ABQ8P8Q9_9CRYT|nr:protein kinase [Cryptosporidium canis]
MNGENGNECVDLSPSRFDRISAHEQVLATKYLSRFKSLCGRMHSPSSGGVQTRRGIYVCLDEEGKEGDGSFGSSLAKSSESEHRVLDSIVRLKESLLKIKEDVSLCMDYESLESNRRAVEEIMDKCNELGQARERLRDSEQIVTRKLALVKNSFKSSVIQYKRIERELNRNQLFWQELQVGLAPATNNSMLKKRRHAGAEKHEKSVRPEPDDHLSRRSQNLNEQEEYEATSYVKELALSRSMTLSKRNNINSVNNSCYTLKEMQKSRTEESGVCSAEAVHYNTIASANTDGNKCYNDHNHPPQINLGYIDEEMYRDGLNFQNLVGLKNRLLGYLNQSPYQTLNCLEILGGGQEGNQERLASSILSKRQDYMEDFSKMLESSGAKLDIDRSLYIKKSRLFRHQQNSRYNSLSTLSASQEYTLLNMIGKGGFAEVWEVLNMNTWSITAAKIHELTPDMTEHERMVCVERVSNEIKLHRDLKHPNIVNMLHCFEVDNDRLVTIMELCDGPDLDTFIKTNGVIPEDLAVIWVRQILEGILYLNNLDKNGEIISPERSPIIHYDLKPGNIILHRGCCKIADFGLSKRSDQASGNIIIDRIGGGTVWYQPPEILLRPGDTLDGPRVVSHKVDIWAIGCIFFEILHLRRPFGLRSSSIAEAFSLIPLEAERGAVFENHVSQECRSFISWLLTYDPEKRPTIFEAFSHPLIQSAIKP